MHTSPTELARELHVPANRISQLVAGKRAMTADTTLRLERWLGVIAVFWMNLQKRYELDLAREKSDEILKTIQPLPRQVAGSRRNNFDGRQNEECSAQAPRTHRPENPAFSVAMIYLLERWRCLIVSIACYSYRP